MLRTELRRYGPYSSGTDKGRMFYIVFYANGTKRTVSRARYMMEHHLGRHLEPHEVVDHINNDKTDDRLENFQILTVRENNTKDREPAAVYSFTCPECGAKGKKLLSQVRHNQYVHKKAGPFCSRQCAGRHSQRFQVTFRGGRPRKVAA